MLNEEIERLRHNEKERKEVEKFYKTRIFIDENGDRIDIGSTVNFEMVNKILK